MSFEEPKKRPLEQSENSGLPEQAPIEDSELNPNKRKFAQELGKVFPAVLEESEDISSNNQENESFEHEADRRKIIARDKISNKLVEKDVELPIERLETSNQRRNNYAVGIHPAGNGESVSADDGREPQHIKSILNTSGYAKRDNSSVHLKTAGPYQSPAGNKKSITLAVMIGFIIAFITLASMLFIFR